MASPSVNLARLHEALHYNPETGDFTWKIKPNRRIRIGSKAGSLDDEGYWVIVLDKKHYPAHRLAWFYVHGVWPAFDVDHVHGDRTNNRIDDLRESTRMHNIQNQRRAHRDSKSGLLGVNWNKQREKWQAKIMTDGKVTYLGFFEDPQEAHQAYLKAKRERHETCTI